MSPRLSAITALRLTTTEPERLAVFYEGLGFVPDGRCAIADDEMALLGLEGGGRRHSLRIARQRIDLDCFDRPGRAYPLEADAADFRFQHFALVTDDAAAAWTRAQALGARPISTGGPVTLPASSGGVTAIKFRDPDGHPLEFLQFVAGTRPDWVGEGLLGIDHSAISVIDVGASRAFYEALGLTVGTSSLNVGQAQDMLDGLAGVTVDVVPMIPPSRAPHLELLGYHAHRGRPAGSLRANDVAATRIVWAADRDALLRSRRLSPPAQAIASAQAASMPSRLRRITASRSPA